MPEPRLLLDRHAPSLHPRLWPAPDALRARWQRAGLLRLPGVLDPGLAAELRVALRALPVQPYAPQSPHAEGLYWRCDVQLPAAPSLQAAPPLQRLRRFLDDDLPALASAALGAPVHNPHPGVLSLWRLRKGAWFTQRAHDNPGLLAIVELTGAPWPASWGGHLSLGGQRWAPACDHLTVLPAGAAVRLPLLTRHVSAALVVAALSPS